MAVKAVAQINSCEGFASPTACTLRVFVRVPASLGPFPTDPEGTMTVTVDPSGLVATVNQQVRDAVKTWVTTNFSIAFNGTDTVKLLGSF